MASKPVAIILAAGEGARIGMPKALLSFDGQRTFLDAVAEVFTAAGCDVLAVLGAEAEKIRKRHPGVATVVNRGWKQGQFSSVKCGLHAAVERGADRILIHPVDAPRVGRKTIAYLIGASAGRAITAPEAGGVRGHPLLVTLPMAARILTMPDVDNLEAATRKLGVLDVTVDDPAVLLNINTPEDYERVFGRPPEPAASRALPRAGRGRSAGARRRS